MVEVVDVQPHHLDSMHKWEMDEELQSKTGIEKPRTYEQFFHSYQSYFRGEKPRLIIKVIELDGRPVGKIELYQSPEEVYIGMLVACERGSGIGSEALELFLEGVREQCNLQAVQAEVYQDNPESLRFFERHHFRKTGDMTVECFRGKERKLHVLERLL
ncbi:GNAT family N-acetyltransferase [Halobacillus litoralis]|uniref:GNAT family N-acetyltransferase n=1 Tax=Halobacillus litoralis TaxID=45668 RepID=UPI001CD48640|nr:GNAT family N-acetyltransferase [Halobacillus litoralis]MCA0972025.1 GNAT family N-acetyltransferase [Halobacillus litoralis]